MLEDVCSNKKYSFTNDSYENLDIFHINFDIFKELSGVIFSVH